MKLNVLQLSDLSRSKAIYFCRVKELKLEFAVHQVETNVPQR